MLVGRIISVKNSPNTYGVEFEDDTGRTTSDVIFVPKLPFSFQRRDPSIDFSLVEFESTSERGKPFFRLWLKMLPDREVRWAV